MARVVVSDVSGVKSVQKWWLKYHDGVQSGDLKTSEISCVYTVIFRCRSLPVGLKITEKGYLGTILENAGGRQEYILSTMGDKE